MALEQTRFTVLGLNPNDVATFIVVLILSFPVLLRWSKYCIWLVWPVEALLIALLVGTGSRGGVLALICGITVATTLSCRPGFFPRNRKLWIIIGLAIFLGAVAGLIMFPRGFRLGTVDISPEASAGRRLEVWSMVPSMLASAPTGWGFGQAAEAYEQWFEPVGETVELKHLLSSHLTWLVEFGWPLRVFYCFLWSGAIALLYPKRELSFPVWGLAVWTAFFVALFYNAAGKWWNWPVPALWILAVLAVRFRQKTPPPWRYWALSAVISGALVVLPTIFLGLTSSKVFVRAFQGGNIVLIGKGEPTIAILGPSKEVLGNFYGQEVRSEGHQADLNTGSIIVVNHPDIAVNRYLSNCHLIMISGENQAAWDGWRRIFKPKREAKLVLINCRISADSWIREFNQVDYCHGEFYADPYYNDWKNFSMSNAVVIIKDIPGNEAYIANWWSFLDNPSGK